VKRLLILLVAALFQNAAAEPLDVPFVRQQKEGCGPAVLSMLMEYWSEHGSPTSKPWTPSALYSRLYDSGVHGVTGESMARFLQEQDYLAFPFHGEWNDLTKNTELGRPVIVALAPKRGQPLHFVLVVGMDELSSQAILHDPDRGSYLKEPHDRFLKQWNETGRWTLLAVPRTTTDQVQQ
jgi:hypothetical protein